MIGSEKRGEHIVLIFTKTQSITHKGCLLDEM